MPSATSTQPISIKVELCRKDGSSTFHRFAGVYTFAELTSVVNHLWGDQPKELLLSYTDDEGDVVQFTSQEEWEECVRLFQHEGKPILRLTAKRAKDEKKSNSTQQPKQERGMNETSSSTSSSAPGGCRGEEKSFDGEKFAQVIEETLTAAASSLEGMMCPDKKNATTPCGSSCRGKSATSETPSDTNQQPPSAFPFAKFFEAFGSSVRKSREQASGVANVFCVDVTTGAKSLLSTMYNCDAAAELARGATEKFGSVVKLTSNPFNVGQIHVGINDSQLFQKVVEMGNCLLEKNQFVEAENLLRRSLIVFPNSPISEYNLACALSLQNKASEAIDTLLSSIRHGYDQFSKMLSDPDLVNARKHPRFSKEVISTTAADKNSQSEEEEKLAEELCKDLEKEKSEAPAPVTPAAASDESKEDAAASAHEEEPPLLKILSIFPNFTEKQVSEALIGAKGDIALACSRLLESM